MTTPRFVLAEGEMDAALASWRLTDPATRERVLIFGAIAAVSLLALFWAAFLRKKRKRRRKHHHSSQHPPNPAPAAEPSQPVETSPVPERRHRSRHSRRRHRPRNPTLAETGGLPPIRTEEPPEPTS